jgi:hypothetical protein
MVQKMWQFSKRPNPVTDESQSEASISLTDIAAHILFFCGWMWIFVAVWWAVGGAVAEGLRYLWPTAPGIVTEDGYSYAVRGEEVTGQQVGTRLMETLPLPTPGTRVDVHYNPLAPEVSYLEAQLLSLDGLLALLMVGAVGGAVTFAIRRTLTPEIAHSATEDSFKVASYFLALGVLSAVMALVLVPGILVFEGEAEAEAVQILFSVIAGAPAAVAVALWLGPYSSLRAWSAENLS